MNHNDKYYLSIVVILIIMLLYGAITLVIKHNDRHYIEIALTSIESPQLKGEVHIDGAVSCPGIFPWNEEDTIVVLLDDAGIKQDADLNHLTIYIPYEGEKQMSQKIDINRAETWLLQALPGIGEIKARAIVNHRENIGFFKCKEDLLLVEGLGEGTLEQIINLITVSD
jgi:competence protein ComEA